MALWSSILSLVNAFILVCIIASFSSPNYVCASPSPLFFGAIANFFNPNRQPAGSSSSYGAPKPNYNKPNTRPGGLGGVLPSFGGSGGVPKLPSFGGSGFKLPDGGSGFKLPGFNFPSFGGIGKRPAGSASYGPPKKPSYRPPGGGSPGRPPISIIPNIFNTSPTRRPSYQPQPNPSRPRPVYRPTQRPNNRPTQRPNNRPTQGRPVLPGYGPPQRPSPNRPGNPRPTRPTRPRPTQPHCNACSGPWNTVPGHNQQTNTNVSPTYFPSFPNNGQVTTGNTITNTDVNNFRQPQYGQSATFSNNNVDPLPTYSSSNQGKFPKNMGIIDSTSSIDSYGSPQAPSIDSYGSPQAPVINNLSQDNYGSSNVNNIPSNTQNDLNAGKGGSNGNQNNGDNDIEVISG